MTTLSQEMTDPNPANGLRKTKMKKSVILSPATKRKGWGVGHSVEFYSPSKKIKIKNFKSKLEFWETKTKTENGNSVEPGDPVTLKERDKAAVGVGWGVYSWRRLGNDSEGHLVLKRKVVFLYLRLLKYIYQYIKHLDIS